MNERKKPIIVRNNYMMLVALIFLCAFGAIMVFSASAYMCSISKEYEYDSFFLLKRQGMFMIAGLAVMLVVQRFSYRLLKGFLAILLYLSGVASIFLLLTPLGVNANGATRWVKIEPFGRFQVSEWVKICVIIFMAYLIDRYKRSLGRLKLTVYLWIVGLVPALILFKISNDLSSSAVVIGICFVMTYISTNTEKAHIIVLLGAVILVGMYVWNIWSNMPTTETILELPFRDRRIAAWLDPERYAATQGYQTLQGLYAIGRGGVFGKGLGASIQKLGPMPEAETDMIFSVICEELGIVGAFALIYLFAYLLYQISRVMLSAPDLFGGMLSLGVFAHLTLQAIFNICVNLAILPNTGLPLPFISYGGTSVFFLLAGEMAIVFSVERRIGKEPLNWRKFL
ncbi:MAG: FtsW/RodA/SpoVE family cell cycle protein [Lachnospiraceae bacterium]|nr:FtsW/RodA/SpoVE family cell cycle protein [Lachnospiraceae bacterium]